MESLGLRRGFTLVEIVIVVLILGILVALGMPNFLRVRLDANERMIRGDLRAFSSANEGYRAFQNPPVYSPDITTLMDQNYIDTVWNNPGNRHGYNFSYAPGGAGATYSLEADPVTAGITGINIYCVDQTGIIVRGVAAGLGTAGGCVGGTPIGT
jgi:general secretion pathway protein G